MNGILNINKPRGKTSFRIIALVRKLSGERRVGHAGTLDPEATGVLPVCIGKATRLTDQLMQTTKTYEADIELGTATDTYDATGQVTYQGDFAAIELNQVGAALAPFRGAIRQIPPMYSAVKHQGRPLYAWARAGISISRKSRPAHIHELELKDYQPPQLSLRIVCGKGTYIRTLADDIGQSLGCGAHLKNLVRTRYGPFDISDALTLPRLEDAFADGSWRGLIHPMDSVLGHLDKVTVDDDTTRAIQNGRAVTLENAPVPADDEKNRKTTDTLCRAYTTEGQLIAILHFNPETAQWQPAKTFFEQ